MKRISTVVLAALVFAIWSSSARATGFEPLGVDGLLRAAGIGFGGGYHSLPKNGALQGAYRKAHCRKLPIVPPPAYPCSPRAPEAPRCAPCNGFAHPGMSQHAAPQFIQQQIQPMQQQLMPMPQSMEIYSPAANPAEDSLTVPPVSQPPITDESKNDWSEIPEANPRRELTTPKQTPTKEPAKDKEQLPEPNSAAEDMLDELESYFGDDMEAGPQQTEIRRLPPVGGDDESLPSLPRSQSVQPGSPPQPKGSDVWW